MKRREFLGLMSAAGALRGQGLAGRPNIVFLMADDLGVFELGCYGGTLIATPNMDRLAKQGMRFTDCYAGATVCAPSRSVLMTGQHVGHTRVRANASLRTGGRVALRREDVTVAEVLKGPEWKSEFNDEAGYATGIFGKWGLGEPGIGGLPNDKGFDEFFGFLNQQHAHEHYPQYLWRNKSKEALKGNAGGKKREYASDLMAREALHFIDRHKYEPFLLYFTPTVPHAHFEAPELGMYKDMPWPEEAKHYAAMVTRFDRYVGKILDKLEETGLAGNTVVFCTSDNGGTFGYEPFGVTGPLRGKKGAIYEGGHRVPMIVRWPGKVQPGSVSGYAWGFVDFLATCAELAEARGVPRNTDGISVVPALLGKVRERKEPLYWEAYGGRGLQQAVRIGKWKGVRQGLEGKLELYDLAADPGEKRDVSSENAAVVARMESYLRGCRVDSEEYPAAGKN